MSTVLAEVMGLAYQVVPLQLCFHEAGHVLIAHAIGRQVTRVSLERDGTGLTLSDGPSSPLGLLLMSVAGDAAERHAPNFLSSLVGTGCTVDERDVDLALDLLAGGPMERAFLVEDAEREVDKLLTEQRGVLDRLARHLLERRVLNSDEVNWILRGVSQ